ncbi:MAG TPA: hypothetical protein VIT44_14835 [Cyclobacteriaceae bacterium]
MVLKLFKAAWFFSLMGVAVSFMYVYASLPENVILMESDSAVSISREALFYIVLTLLAVINVIVFVFSKLYGGGDAHFLTWFYGQIMTLNFFLIIALSHTSLYNSSEKFDYSRIGGMIYGSVGLMIVWALGWPIYSVLRKILNKQTV